MGAQGRVLVTGPTGFVGRHTVAELARSGWAVRGLLRSREASIPDSTADVVVGDLESRPSLRAAVRDVRTVIHLAGRAHLRAQEGPAALAAFRRVNVDGTRALLEEAIAAGVDRFILISSVGAVATVADHPITDTTLARPDTAYGISKLEAEREVLRLAQEHGISVAIIRPAMVFGPGMKGNPLRLFRLVNTGLPLPLGSIENRRNFAYVGNLATALRLLAEAPSVEPGPYLFADGPVLSTPQFIRAISAALGSRDPLIRCPTWLLQAGGALGQVLGRVGLPAPDSDTVSRLLGSLPIESDLLAREIGYRQPYSLDEGLRATALWFKTVHFAGEGA